jgi:hypothetical protein
MITYDDKHDAKSMFGALVKHGKSMMRKSQVMVARDHIMEGLRVLKKPKKEEDMQTQKPNRQDPKKEERKNKNESNKNIYETPPGDRINTKMIEVTAESFQVDVLEKDELVLLSFFAPWCAVREPLRRITMCPHAVVTGWGLQSS